ncbi:hypothetical protein I5Q12_02185 [Serratia marcescens]|uniref:hypothetical protein n=1 Tax=Serratia TaxID=613 RepID=UPI0010C56EB8|nr:hypothetical protein AS657_09090 [Serratia marcescens]MBH2723645.1 hypothetical protein [Serratia marcescens]MBH2814116.1 hypothetical protein [Serratia marcescens]BEO32403.1 hypothetical protein SMQE01_11680 [Serratia marcescens]HEI9782055.1 hypothetical protein [Serratia marcescens]
MGYYFDFLNAPEVVDEKLEFFIRDRGEEERLDNMLITQGVNVRFSFAFYCQYLNHVISIYNDVKYERIKLLTFLKNDDIRFLNYIFHKSPHPEYIIRLLDFTKELRLKLNIKSPYISAVDFGIDNIISEIDVSNGDLLNASYNSVFRDVRKCSFGYAFLDRNINFYVCNNLGNFYEEVNSASVAIRQCVIIINADVDNNVLSELFIQYLPVRIVSKKDGKWKKWLDSRSGFRLGFQHIMVRCESILNSKKYIEPEFKQIIIDLNSWLYHTRNKVERYFEDYHTLHVKKRDFTALNSTMRIFSHKLANTISFVFHRDTEIIERKLNDVGDALSFYFDQLNILYELPSTIFSGIKCIREDANLYRVDAKTPFKENNLSAALNNWLNGRFVGHDLEAKSEENIGNGRTDISIFFKSSRVAIIESKLIRVHSDKNNIKQSIQNGFHQVFTKYSSFLNQEFLFPPRLYLVLFAIDADYKKIRDQIFSVINDLQNEPGLTLIEGRKVSSTWYQYIASSLAGDSPCDKVFIDIILADLRVNDNLDRKHGRYPLR